MYKYKYVAILVILSFYNNLVAKNLKECQILLNSIHKCNPYTSKLIILDKVKYEKDSKKLIISKTLPLPDKKTVKVIPIEEVHIPYNNINESIRFNQVYNEESSIPIVNTEKQNKNIQEGNDTSSKNIQEVFEKNAIYHIKSGDSLSGISYKFSIPIKKILSINNLEKNSTIKIGQSIMLPIDQEMLDAINTAKYKIKKGDTLLGIAQKFHISSKELIQFNELNSTSKIYENKIISLPFPYILKQIAKKKKLLAALAKKKKLLLLKQRALNKKLYMQQRFKGKHKLRVTATAYTSHRRQTDKTPFLAAWNNHIRPGMKIIAVSRDLLKRYGLRNGTRVKIGGLVGYYRVRDKMNKRFRRRIDIYMGMQKRRALRWGRRSVVIYW